MGVLVKSGEYALAKLVNQYKTKANRLIEISDEEARLLELTEYHGEPEIEPTGEQPIIEPTSEPEPTGSIEPTGEQPIIEPTGQTGEIEPESTYVREYLTFEAVEDTTFKFINNGLSYSIDNGNNWVNLNANTDTPIIRQGEKIIWKNNINLTPVYNQGIGLFVSTGKFNVSGNIMSLIYKDNFYNTNLNNLQYCFWSLFENCKIINSDNLILPDIISSYCYCSMFKNCKYLITTPKLLCKDLSNMSFCYWSMFEGCTSLITAPELPATSLSIGCYSFMFTNCSSLITVPQLPVTTLTERCYMDMFYGCTSLTTAPELPATTLVEGCYVSMFQGCTSLNYIKCLAQYYINESNNGVWLADISPIGEYSHGTFIKYKNIEWSTGSSGIPEGWAVIEVEE